MDFYHNLKYRSELQKITDTEVFNAFVDRTLQQNQQILSDLYLMIDDGKIKESLEYFTILV